MTLEVFSSRNLDKKSKVPIQLEDKLFDNEVISHQELEDYAQSIIEHFRQVKDRTEQEQVLFLVEVLSDDHILELISAQWSNNSTEAEARAVVERLRQALVEELRRKASLDNVDKIPLDKIYFAVKDLVKNPKGTELKDRAKNIIREVVDTDNNTVAGVYKDQGLFFKEHRDFFVRAAKILQKMAPHPNIARIIDYNPDTHQFVYEKLHFIPLSDYLDIRSFSGKKFTISLQIIRDCIRGAIHYAENGFVLQDICPENLGVEQTDTGKKGVLPDLQEVAETGTIFAGRMVHSVRYFPPEALKLKEGVDLTDPNRLVESADMFPTPLKPPEMTFQLGRCVEDVVDAYTLSKNPSRHYKATRIITNLRDLCFDMTKSIDSIEDFEGEPTEPRITLQEAERRLNEILTQIESEKLFS